MVAYTTAADIKTYTRLSYDKFGLASDSVFTTFIEALINAAEDRINGACRVPAGFFTAAGLTITDEYHDHDGGEDLYLDYYPVLSITTLSKNEAGLTSAEMWTALSRGPGASGSYLLYPKEGRIYFYQNTPGYGYQNVKATYIVGYSTVPPAITQITKDLTANALRGILIRHLDPTQITQIAMNGGDVESLLGEDMSLTMEQLRALTPYINYKVGVG